jgi:hypothetical protein
VDLNGYSATEIANVFKDHPNDIFPFAIGGCSRFITGDNCRLEHAAYLLSGDGSGTVKVRATATTVTFTVASNDYFDAPGSTIKFSIIQRQNGYYLDQTAHATGSNILVTLGVGLGIVDIPWQTQGADLRNAVLKYGKEGQ